MRDGGVPYLRSSPWEVVVTSDEYTQFIRDVHRIWLTGNDENPVTHFVAPPDALEYMVRSGTQLSRDYLSQWDMEQPLSLRHYAEMGVIYGMIDNAFRQPDPEPLYLPRGLAGSFIFCALWPSKAMDANDWLDTDEPR